MGAYDGYQPDLPSGVSHVFSAAAFRFPHTLVPPGILLRYPSANGENSSCTFRQDVAGFPGIRLCQNWWNAQDVVSESSLEELVLGMASQIAEREDSIIVSDIRGNRHFRH